MIKVAVVEDEKVSAEMLSGFISDYGKANNEQFSVTYFPDAVSLLENYRPIYDILFMDIMMPDLDGMTAAGKIREKDTRVIIIFVTNMSQFAVKGYEVNALDFIVKPLSYYDFCMKMKRAVFNVRSLDDNVLVVASGGGGSSRLLIRDLIYVEVSGHKCRYHMTNGVIEGRNSLSKLAVALAQYNFMSCNSCYLINPSHIKRVSGYTVRVGSDELQISHPKKRPFMQQFNEWISRGGGGLIT